ncbi:MAG: cob(I)yrinic acid a,c-diamide adenosyltransferase [Chloroflexi bacterium]|nr:cob(I)yrinic acid a,c-diamide adenosyltransferase [Chloroflexota bacterium]
MKFLGKGDSGFTRLIGGKRVAKHDPLPEAYGNVDEATSALGLARASTTDERIKSIIYGVQQDLYLLMAELATPEDAEEAGQFRITAEHVARIDRLIAELQEGFEIPNKFVVPGETVPSAAVDLARAIVRRAERYVVKLHHDGIVANELMLRYLNRLSSLLFVMARYEEQAVGRPFATLQRSVQDSAGRGGGGDPVADN